MELSNELTIKNKTRLIPAHGGYRNLVSFQMASIVCDSTYYFCNRWIKDFKLKEQIFGAARSGKQNIAEGSMVSGTSKKSELKLVGVARGSFEELLQDLEDFLRQRSLSLWGRNHPKAAKIRSLAYMANKSYMTYIESDAETCANTIMCLTHQTNYLLDRQLRALEKQFLEEGGFTERLYKQRSACRKIY